MSTRNRLIFSSQDIIDFYSNHLKDFGDSSKGVGWKNELAQNIRFEQLVKVFKRRENFSINDFGCGTGQFYNFLLSNGFRGILYNGYDILGEMIETAEVKLKDAEQAKFFKIESPSELITADYSVASGVFNVKYKATNKQWLSYILSVLEELNKKSRYGFSFNLLTSYSDKEYMQSYLYYADPIFIFDYCKKNFSKNVALLHDYDLYDFTMIIKKI
jgi:SAM-dependent methyltransferase